MSTMSISFSPQAHEYTRICTSNCIWRLVDLPHLGALHLRVTCKSASALLTML